MAANEAYRHSLADLELITNAARQAGEIAMGFFRAENTVWMKPGDSPVTQADLAVNDFLKEKLTVARPHYAWISEETAGEPGAALAGPAFIVDPVDGTRGFLEGNPNWAICIAVVDAGVPVAGTVHCPAIARSFTAARGAGAFLNAGRLIAPNAGGVQRLTGSKRLNEELARAHLPGVEIHPYIPSLACRLVLVATGEIHAVLARPGSHSWDVAAAQVIVEEAGGAVCNAQGNPLRYDLRRIANPAFIASGPGAQAASLQLAKSHGFLH